MAVPIVFLRGHVEQREDDRHRAPAACTQRAGISRCHGPSTDVHGFEMDREGKDSWRHKQAGADTVVLSSPKRIAAIKGRCHRTRSERDPAGLDSRLPTSFLQKDTSGPYSRKWKFLYTTPKRKLVCRGDEHLVAVVSNRAPSVDVPVFRGRRNRRSGRPVGGKVFWAMGGNRKPLEVFLGGKPLFHDTLCPDHACQHSEGFFCQPLKGWDPSRSVEIRLAGGGQS